MTQNGNGHSNLADSVPFCWADKRVLRKIRNSFDSQNLTATALAVYHALTEAASNHQREEFTETIPTIANLAGLSVRTTGERLHDLASIGVIRMSTPKMKAPSAYTLLPFGNGCATIGNGCRTFGKREAPRLPSLEEHEEHEEPSLRAKPQSLDEVKLQAAKIALPEIEAEKFWNHFTSNGWRVGGKTPMRSWHSALSNWKLRQQPSKTSTERDHSNGFFNQ